MFPPVVFPLTKNWKRGSTLSVAVFTLPSKDAVTVTDVVNDPTALAVPVKVALLAPSGTVTVAGTETTEGLLLDKEIVAPRAGAGEINFTMPVEETPSNTLARERLNEKGGTAPRLKNTFALPPDVALCSQATETFPLGSTAIAAGVVGT